MIRITLSWFQYQAGVSYAVFTNPIPKLAYLQTNFIPAVQDYLQTIHGTIEVDTPYINPKLRTNDITIIEVAQQLELTDIQMQRLNQVRIYLGFMWVSKLCTADGKRIRSHISKHQKDDEE